MSFRDSVALLVFTFLCWFGYLLEGMTNMGVICSMLIGLECYLVVIKGIWESKHG